MRKALITGVCGFSGGYLAKYLIDNKILAADLEKTLYSSNLGGMFRSIRFGIEEAHGGGVAIQINYYLEKGAVKVDDQGYFSTDKKQLKIAVRSLAHELLMIEAEGDYEAAAKFIEKYVRIAPEVEAALAKLDDIPIDIQPIYPIVKEML